MLAALLLIYALCEDGYNDRWIDLRTVSALLFQSTQLTHGFAQAPQPQLQCVNSSLCYESPQAVVCTNAGWVNSSVLWNCHSTVALEGTRVPFSFHLQRLACEYQSGYHPVRDPIVLEGSCWLEYNLHSPPTSEINLTFWQLVGVIGLVILASIAFSYLVYVCLRDVINHYYYWKQYDEEEVDRIPNNRLLESNSTSRSLNQPFTETSVKKCRCTTEEWIGSPHASTQSSIESALSIVDDITIEEDERSET
jgi:hypothetical protein